jgi:hypothetical protein
MRTTCRSGHAHATKRAANDCEKYNMTPPEGYEPGSFERFLEAQKNYREQKTEFAPNGKRFRLKCVCVACRRLRFVTPLYPTSKAERDVMKSSYTCADCEPSPVAA